MNGSFAVVVVVVVVVVEWIDTRVNLFYMTFVVVFWRHLTLPFQRLTSNITNKLNSFIQFYRIVLWRNCVRMRWPNHPGIGPCPIRTIHVSNVSSSLSSSLAKKPVQSMTNHSIDNGHTTRHPIFLFFLLDRPYI